jgi:hypothetical protein
MPKASEDAQRYGEFEGSDDGNFGGKRATKDVAIPESEQNPDLTNLGADLGIQRNTGEAQYQRSLEELKLDRPKPASNTDEQPIPLEYRDLIR